MKSFFLKKGWAGKTITRRETIERLNPILRRHHELNYLYDAAVSRLWNRDVVERLGAFLHTARADAGKLSESVLSAGGIPESGVDMNPDEFDPGRTDEEILSKMADRELALLDAVRAERKVEHQMRTRAILQVVEKNTRQRIDFLKSLRS